MSGSVKTEMVLAQLLTLCSGFIAASSYTPHIIIITVDDIGHNDFGFIHKGMGDARTPYIDRFSEVSMSLQNYYVMPNGHSTRSALLTGKHPAHLGTQFEPMDATVPYGLGTEHLLLPKYLKEINSKYKTHAVGQWDLGFYTKSLLPTSRGYDTFYGSYLTYGNYLTHQAKDQSDHEGFDLHDGLDVDESGVGTFKTELYGTKAVDVIKNHDDKDPLHLYVAFQGAQIDDLDQCKDSEKRKQIPVEYYRAVSHVDDPTRQCYLALVKAIDQQFGRIIEALKDHLLIANSVVVFTTTSGGPAAGGYDFNAASNSPYRGSKLTGWEGGVKGVALIFNDMFTNSIPTCIFHVADWIPTLASVYQKATGTAPTVVLKPEAKLYGIDQFNCLLTDGPNVRNSIMHFVYGDSASFTKFEYKVVTNADGYLADMNEWYSISETDVDCGQANTLTCNPKQAPCLFNIALDPCEKRNIAPLSNNDVILRNMMEDISKFNESVKYTTSSVADEKGDPQYNKLIAWQPWVDSGCSSLTPQSLNFVYVLSISAFSLLYMQAMYS